MRAIAGTNDCQYTYSPTAAGQPLYLDLTTTIQYISGPQVLYCSTGKEAIDSESRLLPSCLSRLSPCLPDVL
jgi:hypothetical protein